MGVDRQWPGGEFLARHGRRRAHRGGIRSAWTQQILNRFFAPTRPPPRIHQATARNIALMTETLGELLHRPDRTLRAQPRAPVFSGAARRRILLRRQHPSPPAARPPRRSSRGIPTCSHSRRSRVLLPRLRPHARLVHSPTRGISRTAKSPRSCTPPLTRSASVSYATQLAVDPRSHCVRGFRFFRRPHHRRGDRTLRRVEPKLSSRRR